MKKRVVGDVFFLSQDSLPRRGGSNLQIHGDYQRPQRPQSRAEKFIYRVEQ